MIILRIDDVGRKPGDPSEHGTDGNLDYFFDWTARSGLTGVPAVYGVVPDWVTARGCCRLLGKTRPYELAVHGHDHKEGAAVEPSQMERARRFLNYAETYIPPFNIYDKQTISDWCSVGGTFFMGGFHREHHAYGEKPVAVDGCLHIPANKLLYGHALEILPACVTYMRQQTYSLAVVTLHVPWDHPDCVRRVIENIRPAVVPIKLAWEIIENGC